MANAETGSATGQGAGSGGVRFFQYYHVGPAEQLGAYGWGISQFGGIINGALTFTLDGLLAADTNGNNGSATQIRLNSVTGLPTSGTNFILINNEEISYTGINRK